MSRAAERTIDVLFAVTTSRSPLGLMDVAAATGLDKSTTSRALATLVRQSLISRDEASRRYDIGPGLLSLAAAVSRRTDLLRIVRPFMEGLRQETGETVSLYLRTGNDRVCVDGFESLQGIRRVLPLGESVPLYRGSAGKVILAHLPPNEIATTTSVAAADGLDVEDLSRQLGFARDHGYLALLGDRLPDVATLSVAVHGSGGVIGSLTVAGPAERWTPARMRAFAPTLIASAADVSRRLGWLDGTGHPGEASTDDMIGADAVVGGRRDGGATSHFAIGSGIK